MSTKNEPQGYEIWHLYVMAIIVLIGFVVIVHSYFNPSDPDKWCVRNKPLFNTTFQQPQVEHCFGEGWEDYCQIVYPHYCPEKENGIK